MRIKLNKTTIKALTPKATRYEVADSVMPPLRLRITPAGVKTFVLLYRNAENKQRRYTIGNFGGLTPEAARSIAEIKLAEVKLGHDPAETKQEKRREAERQKYTTLRGFIEHNFEPWAVANRKTGPEMVRRIKTAFASHLDRPLEEITPWIIEKWRKEKLKLGRTAGTVNKDIAVLKSCLSRAMDWGVIEIHPLRRLKLSKQDHTGVVRYLSPAEEKLLRTALAARDAKKRADRAKANVWREQRGYDLLPEITAQYSDHLTPMVLLSMNTGMRRGEVFNLQWQDIDFANNTLAIHGHSAKSGKTRHIPLNAEAMAALKAWKGTDLHGRGLVFPGRNGEPLVSIKKGWAALLGDAGIENFRWHDMRHHFASSLVKAGVDLNTVRELLGHSDFKLTLRYAHLAPEVKAAAVAKLVEGA